MDDASHRKSEEAEGGKDDKPASCPGCDGTGRRNGRKGRCLVCHEPQQDTGMGIAPGIRPPGSIVS